MRDERFLTPTSFVGVLLAHIALLAAVSQLAPKKPEVSQDIQFVDLADLLPPAAAGGAAPAPEPAPPPEPPKPQPKPVKKEPPKPVVKDEPKIKPAVVKEKKADLRVEEKPKKREEPKKIEKPKPSEKPVEKPKDTPKPKAEAPKAEAKPAAKPAETPKTDNAKTGNGSGQAKAAHTAPDGKGTGEGKNAQADSKAKGSGEGGKTSGGNGKGDGNASGGGAGSSAGNPVKAAGAIPTPKYPSDALENGEEGKVVLKVLVAPGGKVQKVEIVKRSGSSSLDRAAKKAAQNGSFSASVWTEFTVPVRFSL
ncbi:MAG: energy transducer TonB [Neisseria sp.]|nr:energy transducer TonB [Neisseria sp.]